MGQDYSSLSSLGGGSGPQQQASSAAAEQQKYQASQLLRFDEGGPTKSSSRKLKEFAAKMKKYQQMNNVKTGGKQSSQTHDLGFNPNARLINQHSRRQSQQLNQQKEIESGDLSGLIGEEFQSALTTKSYSLKAKKSSLISKDCKEKRKYVFIDLQMQQKLQQDSNRSSQMSHQNGQQYSLNQSEKLRLDLENAQKLDSSFNSKNSEQKGSSSEEKKESSMSGPESISKIPSSRDQLQQECCASSIQQDSAINAAAMHQDSLVQQQQQSAHHSHSHQNYINHSQYDNQNNHSQSSVNLQSCQSLVSSIQNSAVDRRKQHASDGDKKINQNSSSKGERGRGGKTNTIVSNSKQGSGSKEEGVSGGKGSSGSGVQNPNNTNASMHVGSCSQGVYQSAHQTQTNSSTESRQSSFGNYNIQQAQENGKMAEKQLSMSLQKSSQNYSAAQGQHANSTQNSSSAADNQKMHRSLDVQQRYKVAPLNLAQLTENKQNQQQAAQQAQGSANSSLAAPPMLHQDKSNPIDVWTHLMDQLKNQPMNKIQDPSLIFQQIAQIQNAWQQQRDAKQDSHLQQMQQKANQKRTLSDNSKREISIQNVDKSPNKDHHSQEESKSNDKDSITLAQNNMDNRPPAPLVSLKTLQNNQSNSFLKHPLLNELPDYLQMRKGSVSVEMSGSNLMAKPKDVTVRTPRKGRRKSISVPGVTNVVSAVPIGRLNNYDKNMKKIRGPLNIISNLESINEEQLEQNSSMNRYQLDNNSINKSSNFSNSGKLVDDNSLENINQDDKMSVKSEAILRKSTSSQEDHKNADLIDDNQKGELLKQSKAQRNRSFSLAPNATMSPVFLPPIKNYGHCRRSNLKSKAAQILFENKVRSNSINPMDSTFYKSFEDQMGDAKYAGVRRGSNFNMGPKEMHKCIENLLAKGMAAGGDRSFKTNGISHMQQLLLQNQLQWQIHQQLQQSGKPDLSLMQNPSMQQILSLFGMPQNHNNLPPQQQQQASQQLFNNSQQMPLQQPSPHVLSNHNNSANNVLNLGNPSPHQQISNNNNLSAPGGQQAHPLVPQLNLKQTLECPPPNLSVEEIKKKIALLTNQTQVASGAMSLLMGGNANQNTANSNNSNSNNQFGLTNHHQMQQNNLLQMNQQAAAAAAAAALSQQQQQQLGISGIGGASQQLQQQQQQLLTNQLKMGQQQQNQQQQQQTIKRPQRNLQQKTQYMQQKLVGQASSQSHQQQQLFQQGNNSFAHYNFGQVASSQQNRGEGKQQQHHHHQADLPKQQPQINQSSSLSATSQGKQNNESS